MKYCPDCGTEYMNEIDSCADCSTLLIDEKTWQAIVEKQENLREQFRDVDLERLCSVNGPVQAKSYLGALEQDKIPALLRSYRGTAFDLLFVHPRGWGEIMVAKSHLKEAKELLKKLEENPPQTLSEDEAPSQDDE